jgi:predicted ferric reductase
MAVRGALWVGAYLVLAISPLLLAPIGAGPGRGFLVELSVALGFVGLAIMGLQFALVARFREVTAPFGQDAVILYHRQISYVALAFILAHPLLLIVNSPGVAALLNPLTAPWPTRFALLSTVGLIVLIATSVWRTKLRLRYEEWQFLHEVLAVVVVVAALAHVYLIGYYVDQPWKRFFWLAYSFFLVGLLGWVRIVKPFGLLRRPWRVERVTPEHGRTTTLTLAPLGHHGIAFEPGQFAWFAIGRSPFAMTKHPFSFSSSAEEAPHVDVSIKNLGDFTSTVANLQPGERVYVDGPYGVFTPDRWEGPGFVLIGSGVGVTPLISMIRTLADRGDVRPIYVFLGNRTWEEATFREQLDALRKRSNLTVIHTLSQPPEDWPGERGRIDVDLIRKNLPPQYKRFQYFICGPPEMMDALEGKLRSLGVPADRIHTERFNLV